MDDKYYCIACLGYGKGERLVKLLNKSEEDHYVETPTDFTCLFPRKSVFLETKGVWRKEQKPLIPGYVLVRTVLPPQDVTTLLCDGMCNGMLLRYGNGGGYEMFGRDLDYAKWVFSFGGEIGVSKVTFKPGQMVKVIDGPMKTMAGRVVRPDKKGRKIWIEVPLMGQLIKCSIAAEFLEEDSTDASALQVAK